MRARTALYVYLAASMAFALFMAPGVVLVPALLIFGLMLVRPRHGWLGRSR
ncbi:hypothetical protein [Nocardia sp. CC227C]|uniref:hypothetical protein n=1 Tax=Nocardia sp. CC227C TaxID=3044562 RepID=UPI00278BD0D6|nr:hypothetical protein [Nocardia sp. CC227C]